MPLFHLFAATEACDDDGLPHTLEHLVFLGSEDYPFKAVFAYTYSSVSCLVKNCNYAAFYKNN